uniref:Uncharacterized protein n=1 Tax=Amphora coffeiformis TaxID=265554 RepID=A0A7S3L1Z7_9STRA
MWMRARISMNTASEDCLRIRRSIAALPDYDDDQDNNKKGQMDPCSLALRELACGMAGIMSLDSSSSSNNNNRSTKNDNLDTTTAAVFVRIVCASSYKARDPMYHTDKAPLRGYVTLHGPGTDFLTRNMASPLEYVSLRSLGRVLPGKPSEDVRSANPLEFIIMKGDYYYSYHQQPNMVMDRRYACMHRSPPAHDGSGRRVIVSFDLADGTDDREWYEIHKKREWRSGMTQRKSHLVA